MLVFGIHGVFTIDDIDTLYFYKVPRDCPPACSLSNSIFSFHFSYVHHGNVLEKRVQEFSLFLCLFCARACVHAHPSYSKFLVSYLEPFEPRILQNIIFLRQRKISNFRALSPSFINHETFILSLSVVERVFTVVPFLPLPYYA